MRTINIKARRKALHMTQKDLAEKVGTDQAAISVWETGKSDPRASIILALADALGCTADELLREEGGE